MEHKVFIRLKPLLGNMKRRITVFWYLLIPFALSVLMVSMNRNNYTIFFMGIMSFLFAGYGVLAVLYDSAEFEERFKPRK